MSRREARRNEAQLLLADLDPYRIIEIEIRVRYAETDQMGVVHHANYLVWFEAARSAYCRERGIDYARMEREGLILPVLEAHCRYLRPAHYEDMLIVRAGVAELRRSLLRTHYEVRRAEELVATGETLQILLDRETYQPRRFPANIAARFLGETNPSQER